MTKGGSKAALFIVQGSQSPVDQCFPLGRVAMPDEVATMASFCAIDAPPSMTGAVLDVNGASYVR